MLGFQHPVFSVSDLNTAIKTILDYHDELSDLWIVGECSNVRLYQAGKQLYFTLSDGTSQINCVIFESYLQRIPFEFSNGSQVVVRGSLKWFQKRGTASFQVVYAKPAGMGSLQVQFEQLKAKLTAEGLFDLSKKKPIPDLPQKIGLITSPDSAAFWDFFRILKKAAPFSELVLSSAVMQGEKSVASIQKSLSNLLQFTTCDVIVILRGGGSSEDLTGFNDESLVRAISKSSVPIITAIGHDIDISLSDFAADHRAATPTDAAHFLASGFRQAQNRTLALLTRAQGLINQHVRTTATTIQAQLEQGFNYIEKKIDINAQRLQFLMHRARQADPLLKLKQGFSIVRCLDRPHQAVSAKTILPNTPILITFYDGQIEAVTRETIPKN